MKEVEVIFTYRSQADGEAAVRKLARDGIKNVTSMELDVSNQPSVDSILDEVEKTFGRLDILVNNAAILIDKDNITVSNVDLVRLARIATLSPDAIKKGRHRAMDVLLMI
jgi:NAD(P)-dependent dehydrogenase (short-subunit alcohol dehydrogenase family)